MSKNNLIDIVAFNTEIGKLGYDEDARESFFQYHPGFLESGKYQQLFPRIIKRTGQVQVFNRYNNEHFRGLPPMIADSLPDMFGNLIFKAWMESGQREISAISVIEQLAYVADRGMGALEYHPGKKIKGNVTIDLKEITSVLKEVLESKKNTKADGLTTAALLNIFKIGTSAGGARPKVLLSENKTTGQLIPGDLEYSDGFNHYLVKLSLNENFYNPEIIEYSYSLAARHLGLNMMDSRLIDGKHFATLRFDRIEGKKKHILTASGMTGIDFSQDPGNSSYENLFDLCLFLRLPHREINELYQRMVFNVVFANTDDHLKNHSFIYDEYADRWNLAPVYDLTYSLNPMIRVLRSSRALSINSKRTNIQLADLLSIADRFTIKNPKGIIERTQQAIPFWLEQASALAMPQRIIENINRDFQKFSI